LREALILGLVPGGKTDGPTLRMSASIRRAHKGVKARLAGAAKKAAVKGKAANGLKDTLAMKALPGLEPAHH